MTHEPHLEEGATLPTHDKKWGELWVNTCTWDFICKLFMFFHGIDKWRDC